MDSEPITDDKLPSELWTEIFAKLPAKILLRLRCVSKTWRSMIENPNFISMHLNLFKKMSNSNKHFLLSWETQQSELRIRVRTMGKFREKEEILGFCFPNEEFMYEHMDYVDGLVLFLKFEKGRPSFDFVLLNPSIRKFLVLPPLPPCPVTRFLTIIGFDPVCNDRKVVLIFLPFQMLDDTIHDLIAVYELRTGCWRVRAGVKGPGLGRWYAGPKVFTGGVMYWLSYDEPWISFAGPKPVKVGKEPKNYTHIVSFDFGNESFSLTGLPGDRRDACEKVSFPFLVGDLFAVFEISSAKTCIWVMKKGGGGGGGSGIDSWSKWYDGDSDLGAFEFFKEHKYAIHSFVYVEKIGMFLFDMYGKVTTYDMVTWKMKDLENSSSRYVLNPYVESLLLCKELDGFPFPP